MSQDKNHEQHESVAQTLARYEQRIAELEAENERLREWDKVWRDRVNAAERKLARVEAQVDRIRYAGSKVSEGSEVKVLLSMFDPDSGVALEGEKDE